MKVDTFRLIFDSSKEPKDLYGDLDQIENWVY